MTSTVAPAAAAAAPFPPPPEEEEEEEAAAPPPTAIVLPVRRNTLVGGSADQDVGGAGFRLGTRTPSDAEELVRITATAVPPAKSPPTPVDSAVSSPLSEILLASPVPPPAPTRQDEEAVIAPPDAGKGSEAQEKSDRTTDALPRVEEQAPTPEKEPERPNRKPLLRGRSLSPGKKKPRKPGSESGGSVKFSSSASVPGTLGGRRKKSPNRSSSSSHPFNMSSSVMGLPSHMSGFLYPLGPPSSGVYSYVSYPTVLPSNRPRYRNEQVLTTYSTFPYQTKNRKYRF